MRNYRMRFVWVSLSACFSLWSSAVIATEMRMVIAPFGGGGPPYPVIEIANADGTNAQAVLPPTSGDLPVLSLAVDPRDQMVYYGTRAAEYKIARVRIDGTGQQNLYSLHSLDPLVFNRSNATPSPYGISLDTVHDKVYWVGGQNNSNGFGNDIPTFIQRSNLDGSNVEIVRQSLWTVSSPYNLVVDGASGKMYWTDMSDFSIRSANLDGSGMQTILNRNAPSTFSSSDWQFGGLAIDFQHQVMFWSELAADRDHSILMSASLDGSGVHSLLTVDGTNRSWFGMPVVIGMAVDPATSQLYFADSYGWSINRLNYDGSNFQTLIEPSPRPFSLALLPVPEPSSFVLAALGLIGLVVWRRRKR
jgi:hypothetical protein